MERNEKNIARKPAMGMALAIAAGFSFYILCMILSLVGPTGSRVAHASKNKTTFLAVLVLTLVLAGASTYVAMQQRKAEGGSLPVFSMGLCVICILFLVILLFNGFAI